jgi:hypothetical protein
MMNKVSYIEVANALRDTSKICLEAKGSYGYATGLYESILADLVADLPKHKQAEVMRLLKMSQDGLKENI